MSGFSIWLLEQMEAHGWRPAEFARKGEITGGALSNILNENRKPGWDICLAIAQVLKIPPGEVFRRAGLLPESTRPDNPEYDELCEVAIHLSQEELANALEYVRWRYQVQARRQKREREASE